MPRRLAPSALALLTLASVGLPGFLTPAIAVAQRSPSACYVPGSGTVYRIREGNTPARCAAGHVEFNMGGDPTLTAAAAGKPGGEPTGSAGGDLGGSYPNPSVVRIQGQAVSSIVPAEAQVLRFANGVWAPTTLPNATLPTNAAGAFDFSNANGFVSMASPETRFVWDAAKHALRAGKASGAQWDPGNVGVGSVAAGQHNTASGDYSFAHGSSSTASGFAAVAVGVNTTAGHTAATAFGSHTKALSNVATAMGLNTTASGLYSTAMGNGTTASGIASTAMGEATTASGNNSTAMGRAASTNLKTGAFVYGDASTGTLVQAAVNNQFVVRAQKLWFGTNSSPTATPGRFLETSTGAYLTTGGTWTNSSDSTRKHAFQSVDGEDVLSRIAALPVTTWSYREENPTVRHMGPTAQEFRRAFGLGDTDKAIATVDADGVSLAAIKALAERTVGLRAENAELRAALEELSRRLTELESARR